MTNQYLSYDKQQWQRVCIIATFHMESEEKCQYRIEKFDSIGTNLTSLYIEHGKSHSKSVCIVHEENL